MSVDEYQCVAEDQELGVLGWRELRFLQMGVSPYRARELALQPLDLHRFDQLLGRGCPPDLAETILA